MSRKKILIFSTAYVPFIGGAEVAVTEITDRLGSVFDFEMVTARLDANLPQHERVGNVMVHRVGTGSAWDKFRLIWQGSKFARKLGVPDAVWAIMASYAGFAALRYKKQNPSVPFLLTLQEGDSQWHIYKHVWWCWPYFTQIFKRADRIQAISTYLAAWAKSLGARGPVDTVPNGVDLEKFKRPVIDRGQVRAELGLPSGGQYVISVSRLAPKNGIADLIAALAFLPVNVRLLLAGNGELEAQLQAKVRALAVADRVAFLGALTHEQVAKYLWASDVFCRPSLSEGLGNSFLEAMAAGVPVVATPVGGIPDFLTDGRTGWFCRPRHPQSIARAIGYVLDEKNQGHVERVVANASDLVAENYSWDTVAGRMKNIFTSFMSS